LAVFGNALHTVTDRTSPAHEGQQPWAGKPWWNYQSIWHGIRKAFPRPLVSIWRRMRPKHSSSKPLEMSLTGFSFRILVRQQAPRTVSVSLPDRPVANSLCGSWRIIVRG
jgi:hypothetical protein